MAEPIITYISLGIAIASILFVVWDHFKDDRLLTKRIKNFYETIENVIFHFYKMKMAELLWVQDPENKTYENVFAESEKQHLFHMGKILQNFGDYSKYLGLTQYRGEKYMNSSNYLLERKGNILTFYTNIKSNPKMHPRAAFWEDHSKKYHFNEDSIKIIEEFLGTLRLFWKNNYYKLFFRRKLKKIIDFSQLMKMEY